MMLLSLSLQLTKQNLSFKLKAAWHQRLVETFENYVTACGCPDEKQILKTSGNLTDLVMQIGSSSHFNDLERNEFVAKFKTSSKVQREKLMMLLDIENFDPSPQLVRSLDDYWLEDISVLSQLYHARELNLVHFYDNRTECIDPYANHHATIFHPTYNDNPRFSDF